jgi:hypothetical protein
MVLPFARSDTTLAWEQEPEAPEESRADALGVAGAPPHAANAAASTPKRGAPRLHSAPGIPLI